LPATCIVPFEVGPWQNGITEEPRSLRAELEILASINATAANELASEMSRLKARIASLQAQLWRSPCESDGHRRELIENSSEFLRKPARLLDTVGGSASRNGSVVQDKRKVRAQHASRGRHAAHLGNQNQLLTEATTARAREVQEAKPAS